MYYQQIEFYQPWRNKQIRLDKIHVHGATKQTTHKQTNKRTEQTK